METAERTIAQDMIRAAQKRRRERLTAGDNARRAYADRILALERRIREGETLYGFTSAEDRTEEDSPSGAGRMHGGHAGSLEALTLENEVQGDPLSFEEYTKARRAGHSQAEILAWAGKERTKTSDAAGGSARQELSAAEGASAALTTPGDSRKQAANEKDQAGHTENTSELSTAQKAIDRILGDRTRITGEKTDWGKLLQGTLYKGSDTVMTSLGNMIDMLFGGVSEEIHLLGVESINAVIDMINAIPGAELPYVAPVEEGSFLKRGAQRIRDAAQKNQEYFSLNANSSRAAQIVDKFGTATVAAVPMALEAVLLGGGSQSAAMTTEGLGYLSGLAQSSGLESVSQMAAEGCRKMLSDPQFWTSYAMTAGDSYQSALDDGIEEDDAALYGLVNGAFSAMIEIGGADDTLGGINMLPMRVRNAVERGDKSIVLKWAKSAFDEGREEIQQGIMERGLKAFAGKDVPVVSFDPEDRDAIINPFAAAEEYTVGSTVGALLGGAQSAAVQAESAARQAAISEDSSAKTQADSEKYLRRLEEIGYLPAEQAKTENTAHDGAAENANRNQRQKNSGLQSRENNDILATRIVSGALNPDSKRAEEHAKLYYESVRHMKNDVQQIAKNTGLSEQDIALIKQFIFLDEHDLGENGIRRFFPSFEIAQSWQRLIDGKSIKHRDLTLLYHEIMERQLMLEGMTQEKAHMEASREYNYTKEVEEYYDKIKKHKKG